MPMYTTRLIILIVRKQVLSLVVYRVVMNEKIETNTIAKSNVKRRL